MPRKPTYEELQRRLEYYEEIEAAEQRQRRAQKRAEQRCEWPGCDDNHAPGSCYCQYHAEK